MSTLEVNTISPISGSSDVTLGGSSKNIKFASGTTVDFSTNTPTLSGLPDNTPNFYAYLSSTTNVTGATATKITFDTEEWDSNSAYDTSTGKFTVPSGQAGKYLVASSLWCNQTGGEGKFYLGGVRLYKNGSLFSYAQSDFNTAGDDSANNYNAGFVAPINLSAGDYLEIYAIVGAHTGTTQVLTGTKSSWFSVHKLIGA